MCPGLTSTELMVHLRKNVKETDVTVTEIINSAKNQTPEQCAINLVSAIEAMKNGAIYICSHGDIKEVASTVHWNM